ncbi:MAG: 2,3-bisphosphoglycerate-independent phosphoglycerate mutase [Myxococcales bacterium]|nr:2,3-bisphosphoglycerate-independent phosphoglycerate mutase [Myxococcales bacterium]MBK7195234.1 2,3-bisphosphoglycerate-independent phosphoglycerate mutase [Myxococcales bacterium]MBP6847509.1 2,3-bisphosphoglycerate-independent phosphoglycerate mutase [Kofleriaceae bacterium]
MSTDLILRRHPSWAGPKGPVVLAILDGVGLGKGDAADAVKLARTPVLDELLVPGRFVALRAHGTAVGLPSDDDMGNSEVGHNALGAGVVHAQGALLVGRAIASGALYAGATWQALIERGRKGGALHFLGLLSDGNVHSHQDHLEAMLRQAAAAGVKRLYVHVLLDGRDVAPTSALTYVDRLETVLGHLRASGLDARIASGGGRMITTMDRYEADWRIVERGWRAHVLGDGRRFASAAIAVATLRDEHPGIIDQDLPPFVIADDRGPVAPIVDGDGVVMFNFRGDRAIEITRAFDDAVFAKFDRVRHPDVLYAGMMEYDGDLHLPRHYLVSPPQIERTMGQLLAATGVTQLAISETQKYGHVTYFWNGNKSGMFDEATETYVEIPSDQVPFEQRPWMKAAEVTDRLIAELATGRHRFARVNYANGDMVGHTGHFDATVMAVEAVDLQLARLRRAVDALGGVLVVTADHGNADEMFQRGKGGAIERDKVTGVPIAKTSHTLAPVPLAIHDRHAGDRYALDPARAAGAGIASVTATCLELLGYTVPTDLAPSLVRFA